MNKHGWYEVKPKDREKLVLELLKQGYTADQLNEYFDVKTDRVISDFMNSRGYSKGNNTYFPKQQKKHMAAAPMIEPQQQNNMMANINIDEEIITNVLAVSKQADKLQEIINWYDTVKDINLVAATTDPEESYIEIVDTSLPIPKVDGEIKRTTIRVNDKIMAAFNKVWKEKYSEYKQHDLLNLALQMFIEKYE